MTPENTSKEQTSQGSLVVRSTAEDSTSELPPDGNGELLRKENGELQRQENTEQPSQEKICSEDLLRRPTSEEEINSPLV